MDDLQGFTPEEYVERVEACYRRITRAMSGEREDIAMLALGTVLHISLDAMVEGGDPQPMIDHIIQSGREFAAELRKEGVHVHLVTKEELDRKVGQRVRELRARDSN